jgi:hypothetical protein
MFVSFTDIFIKTKKKSNFELEINNKKKNCVRFKTFVRGGIMQSSHFYSKLIPKREAEM